MLNRLGRTIFFDLGASLYNKGLGGASQSWFVEGYAQRGIPFDRIFAWEALTYTDEQIIGRLPEALRNWTAVYRTPREDGFRLPGEVLSYFNFGVSANPADDTHPWRLLRRWARPVDFVVVKIDIDTPPIEELLVRQLLEDEGLGQLIDELYFEHHVRKHPFARRHFGWDRTARQTNCTISDSYRVFSLLRNLGIRAHSWV